MAIAGVGAIKHLDMLEGNTARRGGRFPNGGLCYRETRRCGFKPPKPGPNTDQRDGDGEDAKKFHDSIDWRAEAAAHRRRQRPSPHGYTAGTVTFF
jgi:hypothetical protein